MSFKAISLFVLGLVLVASAKKESPPGSPISAQRCSVRLETHLKNSPIYLQQNDKGQYEFYQPSTIDSEFNENESLFLACANQKTKATCLGGRFVDERGSEVNVAGQQCSVPLDERLLETGDACANGMGRIYKVGFQVDNTHFVRLYTLCHNAPMKTTYWSTYKVSPSAFDYLRNAMDDRNKKAREGSSTQAECNVPRRKVNSKFSSVNDASKNMFANLYDTNTQAARIDRLLGSHQGVIDTTPRAAPKYFAVGHLSPSSDFVFCTQKQLTYFYENGAPQFQQVNGNNWKTIENSLAQKVVKKTKSPLRVLTGTYGALDLPHQTTNRPTQIYLEGTDNYRGNKMPVPKYFFKIFKDDASDAAVVIITLNFAYPNNVNVESMKFCQDVCLQAGIATPSDKATREFRMNEKGYSWCCTLDDFKRTVTTLPPSMNAHNLLSFVADKKSKKN